MGFKCHPLTQHCQQLFTVAVTHCQLRNQKWTSRHVRNPTDWGEFTCRFTWGRGDLGGGWVSSELHGHCSKIYWVQHSRSVSELIQSKKEQCRALTKNVLLKHKCSPQQSLILHKVQKWHCEWKMICIQTHSCQHYPAEVYLLCLSK